MRQLNGVYTQHVNRTHGRVGHLFQGRFKGILVEKDSYLLELARYVVLNPVRANMVRRPEEWPWSSYRATAGQETAPPFLATDWLLRAFADTRQEAAAGYRRFVAEGIGASSPWLELKNQVYLGSEQFVQQMQDVDRSRASVARDTEAPTSSRREVAGLLCVALRRTRPSTCRGVPNRRLQHASDCRAFRRQPYDGQPGRETP